MHGHAGSGTRGSDPVCAAASALLWTLIHGLANVLHMKVEYRRNDPGAVEIEWRASDSSEEAVLVETILGSLREIAGKYPGRIEFAEPGEPE